MAKKEDMTKKTDQELTKMLVEQRAHLRSVRFAAAGAKPKDPSVAKKTRVIIARILTEKHARVLRVS